MLQISPVSTFFLAWDSRDHRGTRKERKVRRKGRKKEGSPTLLYAQGPRCRILTHSSLSMLLDINISLNRQECHEKNEGEAAKGQLLSDLEARCSSVLSP